MWINPFRVDIRKRQRVLKWKSMMEAETMEFVKVHFPHGHRLITCR
jgi:hypothetical protein